LSSFLVESAPLSVLIDGSSFDWLSSSLLSILTFFVLLVAFFLGFSADFLFSFFVFFKLSSNALTNSGQFKLL
jgi:hypothetical protein